MITNGVSELIREAHVWFCGMFIGRLWSSVLIKFHRLLACQQLTQYYTAVLQLFLIALAPRHYIHLCRPGQLTTDGIVSNT